MNSIISIVSNNKEYTTLAKTKMNHVYDKLIQDYTPQRKTVVYVSPANSLGFMDGGIDKVLSQVMFSGVETQLKELINKYGK